MLVFSSYRESQVSLAVTLWLSVVIDWTFTMGGVHVCTCLITATHVFIHVLNFHGWSQPRNFPNVWYIQARKF